MFEYIVAFVGWFVWNLALFTISKNKNDALEIPFPYKKYFNETWDNWLFSLSCILPMVWYMEDICSIFTSVVHKFGGDWSWPVYEINYMGCGILAELLYFVIEWVLNKKATLLKGLHKEA